MKLILVACIYALVCDWTLGQGLGQRPAPSASELIKVTLIICACANEVQLIN